MEKEFSPMEAFTCKVIFLKDETSSGRSIHRGPGKWKTPSSF